MSHRGLAAMISCTVLVLPLLAACGGGEPTGGSGRADSTGPYAATEEPTIDVGRIDPPADYREIEGSGFTIAAPGEFQERHDTSPNGEPRLVLEKPSAVPQLPQRVVVIRDVMPEQDAEEQSAALERVKAATGGAEADVHRYELEAPEGHSSFLITWTEPKAGSGDAIVEVGYWQLMYQTDDELILNVVALAPAAEFETSEVSRILRTFEPSAAG